VVDWYVKGNTIYEGQRIVAIAIGEGREAAAEQAEAIAMLHNNAESLTALVCPNGCVDPGSHYCRHCGSALTAKTVTVERRRIEK